MAYKEGQWLPGSKAGSKNPFQSNEKIKSNRTGWKREGGKWVQYRKGKKTGKTQKYATDTNLTGKVMGGIGRGLKKANELDNKAAKYVGKKLVQGGKKLGKVITRTDISKKEQATLDKVKSNKKTKAELKIKNEAVTNPKTKTESKTKSKTKDSAEKAAWLKKSRNSPAAKNFSDDERWALQQRHRAWKAARKKKKN